MADSEIGGGACSVEPLRIASDHGWACKSSLRRSCTAPAKCVQHRPTDLSGILLRPASIHREQLHVIWPRSTRQVGSAGCNGMLPLSATLCCHLRHSRSTIILPPGAIQSCHSMRSRSRLPNPAVRGGMAAPVGATGSAVRWDLPINRPELRKFGKFLGPTCSLSGLVILRKPRKGRDRRLLRRFPGVIPKMRRAVLNECLALFSTTVCAAPDVISCRNRLDTACASVLPSFPNLFIIGNSSSLHPKLFVWIVTHCTTSLREPTALFVALDRITYEYGEKTSSSEAGKDEDIAFC
jgi:hypothetical protein